MGFNSGFKGLISFKFFYSEVRNKQKFNKYTSKVAAEWLVILLRIKKVHIRAKATLKFGSEAWVLKTRVEQRLEVAQIKYLRHLFGITKLDKEKN